jgi:hypothetical protein
MVARGDESVALFLDVSEMNGPHAPPTGDHESPPNRTSSSLAPTDGDGLFLRLMSIRFEQSCPHCIVRNKAHLKLQPFGFLPAFSARYCSLLLSESG